MDPGPNIQPGTTSFNPNTHYHQVTTGMSSQKPTILSYHPVSSHCHDMSPRIRNTRLRQTPPWPPTARFTLCHRGSHFQAPNTVQTYSGMHTSGNNPAFAQTLLPAGSQPSVPENGNPSPTVDPTIMWLVEQIKGMNSNLSEPKRGALRPVDLNQVIPLPPKFRMPEMDKFDGIRLSQNTCRYIHHGDASQRR